MTPHNERMILFFLVLGMICLWFWLALSWG